MLENGKIQCDLCPRHCQLKDGVRGFCFVRMREGDQMVLTTYGRSSGFCIDPVEKKPLNHFYPGTSVLSFGTAGCNLGCQFCQNWDISKAKQMDRLQETDATPERIVELAQHLGVTSIAFTYNDPVIFAEYAMDIAALCRKNGIKTIAVSAGYITPEARKEFYTYMDAANIDLKGFTSTFYKKLCMAELAPVLDTLKYLKHETSVWFEITTLIIPGQNDSEDELHQMTEWIRDNLGTEVPLHFTAFHPDFRMMDTPATPPETLTRARDIARSKGLQYVYTGNIHDASGGSTYCPQCNTLLIERDWYELGKYHLNHNQCRSCGHHIPGHFAVHPGNWGRKRQPVYLG